MALEVSLLSSRKPAIFQFASTSMHFATSLEICSRLSERAKINYLFWGASTSFPNSMHSHPGVWPSRIPLNYRRAIKASNENVSFSTKFSFNAPWVQEQLGKVMSRAHEVKSMGDFRLLDTENLKPSSAISNCLTTLLAKRTFDYHKDNRLLAATLKSYLQVFSAVQELSTKENLDLGLVFNGRFLHERACWDALQFLGIKSLIFETTRDRYFLRPEGFHSREANQAYINKFWNDSKSPISERQVVAEENYRARRYGKNKFVMAPEKTRTEKGLYFVYFTNSDDEAFGFWESWLQPLGDQISAVKKLQQIFDGRGKESLLIRLHPNLANKDPEEKKVWETIVPSRYSKVISYADKVSSYDLMENAKGVLTFGSTIGLEAAFWEKPVAVLADCYFDELGVADKLTSWDGVYQWLDKGHLLDSAETKERRVSSFKRPWFLHSAGDSFNFTTVREIGEPGWGAWDATSFMGITLKRSILSERISRLIFNLKVSRYKKAR